MKMIKSVVSVLTASVMCVAFSGWSLLGTATEEEETNFSAKITDSLLDAYGVSRESLENTGNQTQALTPANSEKTSVLVWCSEDIDYDVAKEQALPVLTENLDTATLNSVLPATDEISANDILDNDVELSGEVIQQYIESERAAASQMYQELNGQFVEQYMPNAEIQYIGQYSPIVIAKLTLDEVVDLAETDATKILDCNIQECEPAMDVSIPVVEADTQLASYGYTGKGVKIGEVENYVVDRSLPRFNRNNIHNNPDSSPVLSSSSTHENHHANNVASIMVGQKVSGSSIPQGIAPNAELYSVSNSGTSGIYESIEWTISQGANVVNWSQEVSNVGVNSYGTYAQWLDHISTNHYVTMVIAAGNNGAEGVSSSNMSYNAIVVGNIDDNNTQSLSDDTLQKLSSYSSNASLVYKPDLCAPGTNINTGIITDSGTSFSAPHVTGAVALLFEAKPFVKSHPELAKAILTASVNLDGKHYCPSSWSSKPDCKKYGAGMLDVNRAIKTAVNENYFIGSVLQTVSRITREINITETGKPMRISLAYLKEVNLNSDNHFSASGLAVSPVANLDLHLYAPDGSEVGCSTTSVNNVEIIDFTPSKTGKYKIEIKNADQSIATTAKYAVAWSS